VLVSQDMDAIKNLLDNEIGIVGVGLVIAATVLTALGKMTTDQWTSYTQWAFGIYAGGTAVHGGLKAIGGKVNDNPAHKTPEVVK